jgi:hypothetical protein
MLIRTDYLKNGGEGVRDYDAKASASLSAVYNFNILQGF